MEYLPSIAISVVGGVAHVMGSDRPVYVRLEDLDEREATVYLANGIFVEEVLDEDIQFVVEDLLREVIE